MKDENGKELSQKEILENAMDQLSDACCFFFELESEQGKILAYMADSLMKLGVAVYHGEDPRLIAVKNEITEIDQ